MSQQYSLTFVNNSPNSGDACVYQTDPDLGVDNVMSLAWFTKAAQRTTRVTFRWTLDYSFVWSETGMLVPGVSFEASQVRAADLQSKNMVTFTKPDAGYTFKELTAGKPGSLSIQQDSTIPSMMASIGIGMSGQGTFAVQAQPNLLQTFTPHPKYWITFGKYEEGVVLDLARITTPAEVQFPRGVYAMTAILQEDNSWVVQPTTEVNALYLQAKAEKGQEARWGDLSSLENKRGKVAALAR